MGRIGKMVFKVVEIFLVENILKGFGVICIGLRSFIWWVDKLVSLFWVEVQDEGDFKNKVEIRDCLFFMEVFFNGKRRESIGFKFCYSGIVWGDDDLVIVYEFWWSIRE